MAVLSTSAWVLHDLGLAAGFGGPLFGKIALHKAVRDIDSEEERGHVLNDAWRQYNTVDAIALAVAGATWFIGRSAISGRLIDRQTRTLVRTKDFLLSGAILTGAANMWLGREMGEMAPEGRVPVESGNEPSPRTPDRARKLQGALNVLGP